LLPADALGRARVRGLAGIVACDIHPVNNVAILRYLAKHFGADQDQVKDWYQHWVGQGFTALEAQLANSPRTGKFCHGETPGLADINLVPQVFNARRYDCDLEPYPTIRRIDEACLALEPFAAAHPMRQPEAAELS
jgi:maleylacetoacetate isomerase